MPLVYEKMMISVFPRFAEEEQRNRSAAGMTADGRSDGVYLDPAVQVLKPFLYKICNRACILIAARVAYIAFAGIIRPAVCALLHFVHNLLNHAVLCTNLLARDESSEVIHIEQRTYVKYRTDKPCGL